MTRQTSKRRTDGSVATRQVASNKRSGESSRFLLPGLVGVAVVVLAAPVVLTAQGGGASSAVTPVPMRAQTVADGTRIARGSATFANPHVALASAAATRSPVWQPTSGPVPPPVVHHAVPPFRPLSRPDAHPGGGHTRAGFPTSDAAPRTITPTPSTTSSSSSSSSSSTSSSSQVGASAVTVTSTTTAAPVTVTVAPAETVVITPAPVTVTVTTTVTAGTGALPDPTGSVPGSSGPFTATGWHSGASGDAAASGAFGAWRGKPIQATAVWGDTTAQEQSSISALDAYANFDGDIDVSVGALAPGDSWSAAASGAYTERWRTAIRSIAARRAGKAGTTYIRFAHEMNGDWFDWKVTSGNLNDFHTAWRSFSALLRQEYPAAKLVFSPNNGNHSDVPVSSIYPGDDVVDVVGVDYYDGWPDTTDASVWAGEVNRTEAGGEPYGPGAWQAFAAAHGKPLAFPEWGLRSGDHPAFIQGMHDFLAAHAAAVGEVNPAGKVVYDVYFDIANGGNQGFMLTGGSNPTAAALYKSLSWGV